MENLVEVKNLKKNYGSKEAVKNISFTIKKDEILGLLGPNGSGKTTTIGMLLGLLKPTNGDVLIDGKKKLSCNIFASDYQNNEITTIEGISNDRVLNVVQKAFKKFNAAQCGYCTSGIIISLTELFNKFKNPKKEQIIKALEGHLCRCGSHSSVFKAIESIMTS
mgnify:CR=1 FL=1